MLARRWVIVLGGRSVWLFLLLLVGLTLPALAQTKTWTGNTDANWNESGNWSPVGVPDVTDDVIIPDVINDPVLSTTAVARTIEVQSGASFSVSSAGSLTINGTKVYPGPYTTSFDNKGTVTNSGTLVMGNLSALGDNGLVNNASFTNNTGGQITINRTTLSGLFNQAGTFTNSATLTIGSSTSVGIYGIFNQATFTNNAGGRIAIDRSTTEGLVNWDGGLFTNSATILIGSSAAVGLNGLRNLESFTNTAGGQLTIDRATSTALYNQAGTFTNSATVTIGASVSTGATGIYNLATINNSGCSALFQVLADAIIFSPSSFSNSGILIENATGNSNISYNSGLVQNLNGGIFTINVNDGALVTVVGNIWTGCTSRDWSTGTNWSLGQIPSATDDVIIPNALNDPVLSTTAVARTVEVQSGASFSISSAGSLTINGTKVYPGPYTTSFDNKGTVTNSGTLVMGNLSALGDNGLVNNASFTNNTGGQITINRTTLSGLFNQAGTFINSATLTIGSSTSVGIYGIFNQATFTNNAGGRIAIDRSTTEGLVNWDGGLFTNSATILIGSSAAVGLNGLRNLESFTNTAGGQLTIDRATSTALYNQAGTFTNSATITIGASVSTGATGLENQSSFTNNACAVLTIFANLENYSSFTNAGLFTVNTTQTHFNNGLTNNGIIEYPQGNPIPNVTNNDLIVSSITLCGLRATPALQLGASNSFTIGTTWYQNPELTTVAGTYSPNSFSATGVVPGNRVYFTVTDPVNGCTRTVSASLIVNDAPVATLVASGGGTLTCGQLSQTLTASDGVGTPGTSYTFAGPGLVSQPPTVSTAVVNAPGVYSVTVANAVGCTSMTTTTIVSQTNLPTATLAASGTLTCAITSVTLTASGGTSYSFAGAGLVSQNASAGTAVVNASGGYSVTVTNTATGCSSQTTTTIGSNTAAPSVSISPSSGTLTCAQPSLTLTAGGTAGLTYRWTGGSTSATLPVNTANTYSVTATAANGCSAVSNTVAIGQDLSISSFRVSSVSVCATQQATLQASGCSGGVVVWSNGTTGVTFVALAASTSVITATCTIGSCSTMASGSVVVGAVAPPPAAILSLTVNESVCPVRLVGRATGTVFVFTGTNGYVYSNVYRNGGTYDVGGEGVLKAGIYTLTVSNSNACGLSQSVSQTVQVNRSCP